MANPILVSPYLWQVSAKDTAAFDHPPFYSSTGSLQLPEGRWHRLKWPLVRVSYLWADLHECNPVIELIPFRSNQGFEVVQPVFLHQVAEFAGIKKITTANSAMFKPDMSLV